jgi:L-threonylcarbamoyladenylate synthase
MREVEAAAAALFKGLLVGIPTDTVYGVAANPMDRKAVAALYKLKGRRADKPIPVLAASVPEARAFGMVDEDMTGHWPGALTVVVRRRPAAPVWIGDADRDTVALRIPDHPVALDLLARTGPLAVTSANRSGAEAAVDDRAASEIFGKRIALYLPGEGGGLASTVVDFSGEAPEVVRRGAVAWGP